MISCIVLIIYDSTQTISDVGNGLTWKKCHVIPFFVIRTYKKGCRFSAYGFKVKVLSENRHTQVIIPSAGTIPNTKIIL